MRIQEIKSLLAEFNDLDGAVIQSFAFHHESDIQRQRVSLVVKAFYSPQGVDSGHWKLVSILACDHVVFGWIELPQNTNLVLNYPVKVVEDGERLIIDLDPLHQVEGPQGIKLSRFFIGGRSLSVSISNDIINSDCGSIP